MRHTYSHSCIILAFTQNINGSGFVSPFSTCGWARFNSRILLPSHRRNGYMDATQCCVGNGIEGIPHSTKMARVLFSVLTGGSRRARVYSHVYLYPKWMRHGDTVFCIVEFSENFKIRTGTIYIVRFFTIGHKRNSPPKFCSWNRLVVCVLFSFFGSCGNDLDVRFYFVNKTIVKKLDVTCVHINIHM